METKEITDCQEREAALDPAGSFIVQAPAGSGKTELLMQRFLALLSGVDRPEEILAMTFTRKAAAEMRSRIVDALRCASTGAGPETPNGRKTFELAAAVLERSNMLDWELLANPERLKIKTIDSFCASIVNAAPILSKTGGMLSISDNPKELYAQAAQRTIEMLDDDGTEGAAVTACIRHLDNSVETLNERLVVMLEKRDQWLRHIKDVVEEDALRSLLEGAVERLVEARLVRARAAFPAELDDWLLGSCRFAASNVGDGSPVKRLAGLSSLPGASAADLPLWEAIGELLLTDKGELRKARGINKNNGFPPDKSMAGDKELFKNLLAEFETKIEFIKELAIVKTLPSPRYDDWEWEILCALIKALPIAVRQLKGVFERCGEQDFVEVASAAIEALGAPDSPTDTLLALDLRLRHILVDEYQDTSYTQLELLRLLTSGWERGDGRTLFVVGDPMQSIFLWREAQVGLFLEAKNNGIGGVPLTALTLRTNFRSQSGIVDWVNNTFEHVFPLSEDVFTGAVKYEPSVAYKDAVVGAEPSLTLFDGRSDEQEAAAVVDIVSGISKAESCVILCRSRQHLVAIVEALKAGKIPFRARDFDPLCERVVVQDLFALLRCLTHPYDRTAMLAVLRAPWCGLTLADIHSLCRGDSSTPVWTLINDDSRVAALSQDGQLRLTVVREKLGRGLALAGRIPLRRLLEGVWIELGGPACLADDGALKDADAFFGVVDGVSVGGRLEPLKSIEGRIKKLYADNGAVDTNLELMTLHRAKGLEYDHVIIPGLGKRSANEVSKLLIWMERGDDLLLAPVEKRRGGVPSRLYKFLSGVVKEKMALEAGRLFYVGSTRARKRLYLFGHIKREPELSVASGSFLELIPAHINNEPVKSCSGGADAAVRSAVALKRLPLSWTSPQPIDAIETAGETLENEAAKDVPVFAWAGEERRQIGVAVHKYLNRIASEGLSNWTRARVAGEQERITAILITAGLAGDDALSKAAAACIDVISKAITDERGRWILGTHKEGATELALTTAVGGVVANHVIDRTFVDPDGVCWVVDYKASEHTGGSIDEFLRAEKKRYMGQLERYAAALRATGEAREIRRGLYYPALGGWIEWGDG